MHCASPRLGAHITVLFIFQSGSPICFSWTEPHHFLFDAPFLAFFIRLLLRIWVFCFFVFFKKKIVWRGRKPILRYIIPFLSPSSLYSFHSPLGIIFLLSSTSTLYLPLKYDRQLFKVKTRTRPVAKPS